MIEYGASSVYKGEASADELSMSKPQSPISVRFEHEWLIRRPVIYRYLEKQYVDSFFETGALRISSFVTFAKHNDEERQDSVEGRGMVFNNTSVGQGQTIITAHSQGQNAYVLCGAMRFRPELAQSFGTDSGFRINDSTGFGEAISRYIPGFHTGTEGPCLYLAERTVGRHMGPIDFDALKVSPQENNLDLGRLSQTVFELAGDDLLFIKSNKFAHQNEYRLLWGTSGNVTGHIDIICPEARQFCTPFEKMLGEG